MSTPELPDFIHTIADIGLVVASADRVESVLTRTEDRSMPS